MEKVSENEYKLGEALLATFYDMVKLIPLPLEPPSVWVRRERNQGFTKRQYSNSIYNLKRKGLIKLVEKNNKKFVQITSKGQLEVLMKKTHLDKSEPWDGKWRLFMFDIPEDSKEKRYLLRALLTQNNFVQIQKSVYVSPYPLNREGVDYLNTSGLKDYITIAKVEEFDDDKNLKKKFELK